MLRAIPLVVLALSWTSAWAQEQANEAPPPVKSTEELTKSALQSVVVISHEGRTEGTGATGTGFIIDSKEGLIATNWHVINDRRRIQVELYDGTIYKASAVHAWDRRMDLALIKIEPKEGAELRALELGNSDELIQGQSVIALGNPRGLKFSVVEGVVGALRDDINESPFPLIQVSMPVEEGNSGGPLLDRQGRVHGVISLKSMMTPNLGFATPINALRILLDKPNPMPMDVWATIGALDSRRWSPLMGAEWSQHGGKIQVKGNGAGFGGRSLCLANRPVPENTYEVEVEVKLDDEAGAAGLAFASDGGNVHYGFYPSGGGLRLTRFEGPDVYSWEILEQLEVPAYKLGDWNRIKVRVEPGQITCYVNDTEVVKSTDDRLRGGKVGLCKFRRTEAEFRNFKIAERLAGDTIDPKLQADFSAQIESFLSEEGAPREELLTTLTKQPPAARASLQEMEAALKLKLDELRRLTRDANSEFIGRQMSDLLAAEEKDIDLFHAGLLIAKLDYPELEIDGYRETLDQMGAEVRERLPEKATETDRINEVRKFMFEENGFHGSRLDYYSETNSYLNAVLDDREGIPITLSVIFMELARRAGSTTIHGVGLPGHFVAGYKNETGEQILIDTFESGKAMNKLEAVAMVGNLTGTMLREGQLEPVPKKEILLRMLRNLIGIKKGPEPGSGLPQFGGGAPVEALPYLNVTLAIDPENASARFDRAILRFQEGDREGAKVDLRWLLQNEPPGLNIPRLREFYDRL